MLDQNTDRMWYVIGAVLVGAAIILIANGTIPEIFASVTDSFDGVTYNAASALQDIAYSGPIRLSINRGDQNSDGTVDVKVLANSEHGIASIKMKDGPAPVAERTMLHFDGNDDYLDMFYDFGDTSSFTIGAEVNHAGTNNFLINHYAGGGWQLLNSTVMKTDGISRWQGDPTYDDDYVAPHPLHGKNVTSKVTVTWDGHTLNRYIDGELVGSQTVTGAFNLTTVHIGSRIAWSTKEINGYSSGNISDFYVMKGNALSGAAVKNIHNNGVSGSESGLVLHYDFEEGSGDTIYDKSGNGKHGTIHGASWIPVFNVSENGEYTFEVTDNEGNVREQTVKVSKVRR